MHTIADAKKVYNDHLSVIALVGCSEQHEKQFRELFREVGTQMMEENELSLEEAMRLTDGMVLSANAEAAFQDLRNFVNAKNKTENKKGNEE